MYGFPFPDFSLDFAVFMFGFSKFIVLLFPDFYLDFPDFCSYFTVFGSILIKTGKF
jgi:hypothetical protein